MPLRASDLPATMAKALGVKVSKPAKYRAEHAWVDGIKFDSRRESRRYGQLLNLVKAKAIENLQVHPKYPIAVNDIAICIYEADFRYFDRQTQSWKVEDVKSEATRTNRAYRIKKKLVEAIYGIRIIEV